MFIYLLSNLTFHSNIPFMKDGFTILDKAKFVYGLNSLQVTKNFQRTSLENMELGPNILKTFI